MSDKINLSDVESGFRITSTINSNNKKIEDAINTCLSRTSTGSSQMEQDLDMNSARIVNLQDAIHGSEPITLDQASEIAGVEVPLTRENVGGTLWPPTSEEAGLTVVNEYYPGVDGPFIDPRRYGLNGFGDDTVPLQTALTVADRAGGGVIQLPNGSFTTGPLSYTKAGLTIRGSGMSDYFSLYTRGTSLRFTNTTGDCLSVGLLEGRRQTFNLENILLDGATTGAIVALNILPFTQMKSVFINNRTTTTGYSVYAYGSHHFQAIGCTFANTAVRAGMGLRFRREFDIGGLYTFVDCRFRDLVTGVALGQLSAYPYIDADRDYDLLAPKNFPVLDRDDVNLNLFSSQFKSTSCGVDLGGGAGAVDITGNYFEGGGCHVRARFGAKTVNVKSNMFNLGQIDGVSSVQIGQGPDSERKYFYNVNVTKNYFRAIGDGSNGVRIVGLTPDVSDCTVEDNFFEIEHPNGVAVNLNGGDYVGTIRRNIIDDRSGGATYVTFTGTATPKLLEHQKIDADTTIVDSHINKVITLGALVLDDTAPELMMLSTDGSAKAVYMPLRTQAQGRVYEIINTDATQIINVREENSTEGGDIIAVLEPVVAGEATRVKLRTDGVSWYHEKSTVDIFV